MQVKWGNVYSFLTNGLDVASRTRLVLSDAGRPCRYLTRYTLSGALEADTQADLTAAQTALQNALLVPYQDLVLYQDSGAASSAKLLNSASLSGVRVVDGPHFPGGPGDFATLRRFEFTAEAEYLIASARNAVLSFAESVSVSGTGGPVTRHRLAVNARPVKQIVYPASVVRATQTGTAVGHTDYPTPPPPLWPGAEMADQRRVERHNPRRLGRALVEYPVSWSYVFESVEPLVGLPGIPPL